MAKEAVKKEIRKIARRVKKTINIVRKLQGPPEGSRKEGGVARFNLKWLKHSANMRLI